MVNVVLLRVGIDTGSGGIHGPLFSDGTYEYIPIPDGGGNDERTYGTLTGMRGRPLAEYFPARQQGPAAQKSVHMDPEFETYTYGDPGVPKSGLRRLLSRDILAFYCGLKGWDCDVPPALYLFAYFVVESACLAHQVPSERLQSDFGRNFHVRHPDVFREQRTRLVLVKGGSGSRLLQRPVQISEEGQTSTGRPLKVLSHEMYRHFGTLNGRLSLQRSPPRWVDPAYAERAATFIRSLP